MSSGFGRKRCPKWPNPNSPNRRKLSARDVSSGYFPLAEAISNPLRTKEEKIRFLILFQSYCCHRKYSSFTIMGNRCVSLEAVGKYYDILAMIV